ncbi:MAG: hypothetical protein ABSB33_13825 [Tepidisphaeraceae bacterium]|jgi:hypothetical protein
MNTYFAHMLIFLFSRYLHIVCATILVGGTLFYEMVVPAAIDDLTTEQQLIVFARARWFSKWIIWLCSATILISGGVSSYAHWEDYNRDQVYQGRQSTEGRGQPVEVLQLSPLARPGWWWAAHASSGLIAVIIALGLTIGKVPPSRPIRWMRLNLVILLVVMFFATATRQTRIEASSPPTQAIEPVETGPR